MEWQPLNFRTLDLQRSKKTPTTSPRVASHEGSDECKREGNIENQVVHKPLACSNFALPPLGRYFQIRQVACNAGNIASYRLVVELSARACILYTASAPNLSRVSTGVGAGGDVTSSGYLHFVFVERSRLSGSLTHGSFHYSNFWQIHYSLLPTANPPTQAESKQALRRSSLTEDNITNSLLLEH